MSTSTQIHIEPVPQVYETRGEQAVPIESILGPGGTTLLRKTLADIDQIRRMLGEEAADQLNWVMVSGRNDCYTTTVDGVSVMLDVSGHFARVSYSYSTTSLTPPTPGLAQQQAVGRRVNQLLAVAMAQRVTEQLKQRVSVRARVEQRQTVSLRMSNPSRFTLQTSTYHTPR